MALSLNAAHVNVDIFQRDDVDFVRTAIVFGADVNHKNHQIHSPRHTAAVSKGKNK